MELAVREWRPCTVDHGRRNHGGGLAGVREHGSLPGVCRLGALSHMDACQLGRAHAEPFRISIAARVRGTLVQGGRGMWGL